MKNVEIEIFPIAKTAIQTSEVRRWLSLLGAGEFHHHLYDEDGGLMATDPALLIAMAAKRCYMSFQVGLNPNVTKVRKDFTEYLDNVLKSGHGSVLEHASYTFAIEGVSRVFTGEMNRHRAGVGISEGSMRYIRFSDIPYWVPTSIRPDPSDSAEVLVKKQKTREIFQRAFQQAETNYIELQETWSKELLPTSNFTGKKHVTSMMRRIIPMGVASGGVWTMNLRAVRHIIALRASAAAEEEILQVFSRIAKIMVEEEPMLCGDFGLNPDGYWVPKYPKV